MFCLLNLNYWAFYLLHSFMRNCTHPSSPVPSTGCHTSPPSQQWLEWHRLGFTVCKDWGTQRRVSPPDHPPHPRERPRWNQIISLTLPPVRSALPAFSVRDKLKGLKPLCSSQCEGWTAAECNFSSIHLTPDPPVAAPCSSTAHVCK